MDFWRFPLVGNVLTLTVLLALAAMVRSRVGPLRRLAIPDGIVAGALGFALGPSVLGLAPLQGHALEPLVYHGFAIVFVAVGLQGGDRVRATGSARSLAFAFIVLSLVQAILAFALLAAWAVGTGEQLHPGLGFMITLGFAQGPGQALAFGSAWEPLGMVHGAQIGLLFAALGFAWCCVLGVPLVAVARRRGWLDAPPPPLDPPRTELVPESPAEVAPGSMEPLTAQLVVIGCVYATVFAVLWSLAAVLPDGSTLAASLWGFHFIVGSIVAILVRRVVARRRLPVPLHDGLLGGIASTAVDFTTAAALSAIELDALGDVIVPILVMSSCGGVLTLVLSLWLARRAFPEAPFSHALVLYGTCTGTVPTGLALLRIVDPQLRGPVARSTIIAVTAGVPIGLPLFLGIIPVVVARWSAGFWPSVGLGAALLVGYTAVLVWIWARVGPLRLLRPLTSLWPELPQDHSVQIGAATIRSPNP